MTLGQFVPHFVSFTAVRCKSSTLVLYRRLLDRVIVPQLGQKDLRHISTADVMQLQTQLAGTPTQANRTLMLTMRLLRVARLHGYKTQLVERPPSYRERSRTRFLSRAEAADLLRRLAAEPSISAKAVALMLLSGLRKSEALGLRWSEVDLDRRLLVLDDTKVGQSVRPLSREAARLLASLPRVDEYVFPGGGRSGHLFAVERVWRRIRREAGLDGSGVVVHTLRHSFASLAVSAGVPLYTVGKALGHKTPSMTARYSHLSPDAMQQAAETVATALAGPAESMGSTGRK